MKRLTNFQLVLALMMLLLGVSSCGAWVRLPERPSHSPPGELGKGYQNGCPVATVTDTKSVQRHTSKRDRATV